ncbi:hypothetical protein Thiowin_04006 [Thiorhodovibrio winogradskyi]|uniref:Type I restriction enzyme R protein C-terminal domain-containing protein n=1 Tax=Thiorhodovibrio winogradskyi TaxID=77007 RepID=A0ABZ0SFR2_9GAMM|nr:hypothetical protein [Thiorhodovibrio winogradskyi]
MSRAEFIKRYKEVQKLKNQLEQYADLSDDQRAEIIQCQ